MSRFYQANFQISAQSYIQISRLYPAIHTEFSLLYIQVLACHTSKSQPVVHPDLSLSYIHISACRTSRSKPVVHQISACWTSKYQPVVHSDLYHTTHPDLNQARHLDISPATPPDLSPAAHLDLSLSYILISPYKTCLSIHKKYWIILFGILSLSKPSAEYIEQLVICLRLYLTLNMVSESQEIINNWPCTLPLIHQKFHIEYWSDVCFWMVRTIRSKICSVKYLLINN